MLKKSIAMLIAVTAAVSTMAVSSIAFASGRPATQPSVATVPPQAPVEIEDPSVPLAGVETVNVMKLQIGKTEITINDEKTVLDVAPVIVNDRTMVPLRAIAEGLLADVAWDGVTRTVTIKLGEDTVAVVIDSSVMTVNGKAVTLDAPAFISNDRTMVPLRAISEAFDADVVWDETVQEVTITTGLAVDSQGEPTEITPEASADPEATVDPTATAAPEETADPEATVDPEATADPAATETPEASATPAA